METERLDGIELPAVAPAPIPDHRHGLRLPALEREQLGIEGIRVVEAGLDLRDDGVASLYRPDDRALPDRARRCQGRDSLEIPPFPRFEPAARDGPSRVSHRQDSASDPRA